VQQCRLDGGGTKLNYTVVPELTARQVQMRFCKTAGDHQSGSGREVMGVVAQELRGRAYDDEFPRSWVNPRCATMCDIAGKTDQTRPIVGHLEFAPDYRRVFDCYGPTGRHDAVIRGHHRAQEVNTRASRGNQIVLQIHRPLQLKNTVDHLDDACIRETIYQSEPTNADLVDAKDAVIGYESAYGKQTQPLRFKKAMIDDIDADRQTSSYGLIGTDCKPCPGIPADAATAQKDLASSSESGIVQQKKLSGG
jgi:hypothetical protein